MNYFGMSYFDVLYTIPYPVLVFLSASIPKYTPKEKKEEPKHLFDILANQMGK